MAPVLRTLAPLGLLLVACSDGNSKRNIEMVALPPPSASPEPTSLPDPSTPAPHASTASDPGGVPKALPRPAGIETPGDSGSPPHASEADLKSAITATGWTLVGSVQTTREGAFDVLVADVRKSTVKGRVRLVHPRGEPTGAEKVPYLPADANAGVVVEIEGGKGGEAYFYDRQKQTVGRVELKPPGTRREASDLLRASFPFVH